MWDMADCTNYRLISLLTIGYKLFAAMLLARLEQAGAGKRIWPTQFGFRSGCGTADALFLARKALEDTWALKDGRGILLAVDWAKAFDCVAPAALCTSLRRFGIPEEFVEMIRDIYSERKFTVRDAGIESEFHDQHNGISQGCPLSPFLFVIIMTTI